MEKGKEAMVWWRLVQKVFSWVLLYFVLKSQSAICVACKWCPWKSHLFVAERSPSGHHHSGHRTRWFCSQLWARCMLCLFLALGPGFLHSWQLVCWNCSQCQREKEQGPTTFCLCTAGPAQEAVSAVFLKLNPNETHSAQASKSASEPDAIPLAVNNH